MTARWSRRNQMCYVCFFFTKGMEATNCVLSRSYCLSRTPVHCNMALSIMFVEMWRMDWIVNNDGMWYGFLWISVAFMYCMLFFLVLYVWTVLGLNESELVYYFILFFCTSKAGWAVKWVKSVHGKVESMVFQREYG